MAGKAKPMPGWMQKGMAMAKKGRGGRKISVTKKPSKSC